MRITVKPFQDFGQLLVYKGVPRDRVYEVVFFPGAGQFSV